MDQTDTVVLEASPGGVAVVRLNRPDKHNAFNADIIAKLSDTFETLRGADELRVVFLRSAGKNFSAGADLEWMRAASHYDEAENREDALKLSEMLNKLYTLPCLTVAMVQGAAMGGGAGLVAACDVAVAQKSAKFSFSEVKLGIIPAVISPFVINAVGPKWARALFATAESFDAPYAEKMGLVQYVVEDDKEMDEMGEYLAKLAFATAPHAVDEAKRLVRDVAHKEIDTALMRLTAERIARQRAGDEGKEGVAAFLEKRKPRWMAE